MFFAELNGECIFTSINFMDNKNPENGSTKPVPIQSGFGNFDYSKFKPGHLPNNYEEMLEVINTCGCYAETSWRTGSLKSKTSNPTNNKYMYLMAPIINTVFRYKT